MTIALLAVIIALNVAGIFASAAADWPGLLDLPLLILSAVTGVVFLAWICAARKNTATYGPGRIRRYSRWTVAGWLCPAVNLWIPDQITAEIMRASVKPAGAACDQGAGLAAGGLEYGTAWSGRGTWRTGACDQTAPGICLTVGGSVEDGWTMGSRSSPILLLPAALPGQDPDAGYDYEFRK